MSVKELVLKWYYSFTSEVMSEEEALAFLRDCDFDEDKIKQVMETIAYKYYSN